MREKNEKNCFSICVDCCAGKSNKPWCHFLVVLVRHKVPRLLSDHNNRDKKKNSCIRLFLHIYIHYFIFVLYSSSECGGGLFLVLSTLHLVGGVLMDRDSSVKGRSNSNAVERRRASSNASIVPNLLVKFIFFLFFIFLFLFFFF